ncbi:unnamed protein product [Lathyrus oleraceus]
MPTTASRIIVEGIRPNYSYQDIGGAGDRETWHGLVNRRSQSIIGLIALEVSRKMVESRRCWRRDSM